MNVVGNAYIGNVMLTTTSSLVQQVKISNDGVRKHNWGVGGVWWGGVAGTLILAEMSITGNTDIAGMCS
jgi:hypothetical protein